MAAKKAAAKKAAAKKTVPAPRPRPRAQVVLKSNPGLARLRGDLQNDPALRKRMTEDPQAVLDNYKLKVEYPAASMMIVQNGLRFPQNPGIHADAHADAHVDVDPHIDVPLHIDFW